MIDLSKFRELLEEAEGLESTVADLSRQKTSLDQDIVTMGAKKRYLETSLANLTEQISQSEKACADVARRHKQDLTAYEQRLKEIQDRIKDLEIKERLAASSLDTVQQQIETDIEAAQERITEKKRDAGVLDASIAAQQEELNSLEDKILKRAEKLHGIDVDIEAKEKEYDANIATANQACDVADAERRDAEDQLVRAQTELREAEESLAIARTKADEYEQKLNKFKEYEERAIKALDARETSLQDREAAHEQEVATSRRRSRVIDQRP